MKGSIRRAAVAGVAALGLLVSSATAAAKGGGTMYGMTGKMKAKPGERAALIALLKDGTAVMPGCLLYTIAEDAADPDAIWITEAWTDKAAHDASLSLPAVRDAITKGRPLIAGFELSVETTPVAGVPSR